jgi:hypothetical protein
MIPRLFNTIAAACVIATATAFAQQGASASDAELYFVTPEDGATVSSPVTVVFGLRGMGVAPAGIDKDNTGHHHLLVDRAPFGEGERGEEELTTSLLSDENHLHFGGGQTEASIELAPGDHTLQLVLVPHDPPVVSRVITVTVE